MPQKRKASPSKERQKLFAAIALGILLVGILLWPAEDPVTAELAAETAPAAAASPRSGRPLRPKAATATGTPTDTAPTDPAPPTGTTSQPAVELPRLDLARIAAADPFIARIPEPDSLENASSSDDASLVTLPPRASVSAVYRTSRGAAAIVDGQIIPVRDAKHWITTLRTTDLQD